MTSVRNVLTTYTPNTVYDSFPWPQNLAEKQIKEIALLARKLRQIRKEVMSKQSYTYRELYRIIEKSYNNPVTEIQNKLDKAVEKAYGITDKNTILQSLLDLNLALFEKEKKGELITGPGLPEYLKQDNELFSNDCIQMPLE